MHSYTDLVGVGGLYEVITDLLSIEGPPVKDTYAVEEMIFVVLIAV